MTTRTLERKGARLVYDVIGDGAPMIVVPGGPGFGSTYLRDSLGRLGDADRRLIFVDQRGSGRSTGHDRSELLTIATFVDDLEAIRVEVGADCVDVVSHSFGGLQTLYYALTHRNRVRSLILIESDPPTFREWRRFREVLATRNDRERDQLLASIESRNGWQSDPDCLEAYFRAFLRPYFGSAECAARLTFGFAADSFEKMTTTTRAVRDDLGEWDIMTALPRLKMPTLIIYGDRSIFPASAISSMRAALPHASFEVMQRVGHFPFLEDPEAFLQIVRDFLATL